MAYVVRLPIRFDHVDYAQVVYFPRFFGYCHNVFEDFFRDEVGVPYAELLGKTRIGFPSVHSEADFRAPLRFGDTCRVVMETTKVSARSLGSRYRLYRGEADQLCAEVRTVVASVDLDRFAAVDVPDNVREAFTRHLSAAAP